MILLNPRTQKDLDMALSATSHAILVSGAKGAGKGYTARYLAAQKLGLANIDSLLRYAYFRVLAPEDNTLSIDQIRELQKFLRLKTLGKKSIRRIAIIEDAHTMTHEAQNALLKSLEEPPADTVIILTAPATRQLKDTIYSRVQHLTVLPVNRSQAIDHFGKDFAHPSTEKAYLMSGGLPGLMHALLHDEDHPLAVQAQIAKQIMTSNLFDRMTRVDELAKQKDQLPTFLGACKLVATTALRQAHEKSQTNGIQRWHRTLKVIHQAEATLPHNPNPKLLLTHLFLGM